MDFEIKDLEIIESTQGSSQPNQAGKVDVQSHIPNSIILNELHKENEELQNKLKLNYRRLLLFETENNKLIEEKNKLFFETQNYMQKNQLLEEKNEELQKQYIQSENMQKLMLEKVSSLESINRTQMSEIRRFTKFHDKIQQVVKPLVLKLKTQIKDLSVELSQQSRINRNLNLAYTELKNSTDIEAQKKDHEIENLIAEKNGLMFTYEEQIHSFSKEILELQAKNADHENEITRLKKAVEFKNYFENEVIRFKRIHEEDQQTLAELIQKKSAAEAKIMSFEQSTAEMQKELGQLRTRFADVETTLEVTRSQLSKKLDELSQTHERLARLEKLNNQLSMELSLKQS